MHHGRRTRCSSFRSANVLAALRPHSAYVAVFDRHETLSRFKAEAARNVVSVQRVSLTKGKVGERKIAVINDCSASGRKAADRDEPRLSNAKQSTPTGDVDAVLWAELDNWVSTTTQSCEAEVLCVTVGRYLPD